MHHSTVERCAKRSIVFVKTFGYDIASPLKEGLSRTDTTGVGAKQYKTNDQRGINMDFRIRSAAKLPFSAIQIFSCAQRYKIAVIRPKKSFLRMSSYLDETWF